MGEEHEQVFSKMSLYAYVTKHMSTASKHFIFSKLNQPPLRFLFTDRIDLLSAAILYWNWSKIDRMPSILSRRLKRVCLNLIS